MSDGNETFESTKARLEEILGQVRKKDTSLEQSLELLEEGVRLANRCNELIDQTSWRPVATGEEEPDDGEPARAAGDGEAGPADAVPGAPDIEAAYLAVGDEAGGAGADQDDDYLDDQRS